MSLRLHSKNKTLVVRVEGELDLVSAQQFRETVDRAFQEIDGQNLIIDLAKVTFIDSSGLGVILGRYRIIIAKKGVVVLCGVNKTVQRILELSGLFSLLAVCAEEREAWKIIEERAYRGA